MVDEGDGAEIQDGDQVLGYLWIGNGYTQKKAYSTYDERPAGDRDGRASDLSPVFKDAVLGQRSAPGWR